MCYSAMVEQDHREFLRAFPEAKVGIREFAKLMEDRLLGRGQTITKAMEHSFLTSERADDAEIALLIRAYRARRVEELGAELSHQEDRVRKATDELAKKVTKKWQETLRIATSKARQYSQRLADLTRDELLPKDFRIYPKGYAPVLIQRDGELVILPMRYLCRPENMPAMMKDDAGKLVPFEVAKNGCYNARRDNLTRFWKKQFGATHGVVMMQAFYENVWRHNFERRDLAAGEKGENAIVEFRPDDNQTMFVACIWSHWIGEGDALYSFAVVTDEPPPEVRAAGHDRCPIQIRKERVRDWLATDQHSPDELMAMLDDRPQVTYQGRLEK